MTEELTIETLPVEIKVIRVGGHKMTKAVFNQIPILCHVVIKQKESLIEFEDIEGNAGVNILGWVNTESRIYVIIICEQKLFRMNVLGLVTKKEYYEGDEYEHDDGKYYRDPGRWEIVERESPSEVEYNGERISILDALVIHCKIPQLFIAT